MSATLLAYVDNDNVIKLEGLRDADDAYINNATVTCTAIKTAAGVEVSGDTFPKALSYISASNGNYRATLQETLALEAGESYVAYLDVTGGGLTGHFEAPFVARTRTRT